MDLQNPVNGRSLLRVSPASFEYDPDYVLAGVAVDQLRHGVLDGLVLLQVLRLLEDLAAGGAGEDVVPEREEEAAVVHGGDGGGVGVRARNDVVEVAEVGLFRRDEGGDGVLGRPGRCGRVYCLDAGFAGFGGEDSFEERPGGGDQRRELPFLRPTVVSASVAVAVVVFFGGGGREDEAAEVEEEDEEEREEIVEERRSFARRH